VLHKALQSLEIPLNTGLLGDLIVIWYFAIFLNFDPYFGVLLAGLLAETPKKGWTTLNDGYEIRQGCCWKWRHLCFIEALK